MKITVHTEDEPEGMVVDWPHVPGTGDFVTLRYPHNSEKFRVERVEYETDKSGALVKADVYLTL